MAPVWFLTMSRPQTLSLDPLPYVRTQALSLIFTLLRDKPEQEHNLLRLLVNKLVRICSLFPSCILFKFNHKGDTEKSLCSRASYHLLQLVQSHPSMKSVIVREITSLVLRPPAPTASSTSSSTHIRFNDATSSLSTATKKSKVSEPKKETNAHARYYATITYNQIVLSPGDREVALQLINVYFEMFKELLGEGSSSDKVRGADDDATSERDDGKKRKGKEEGRKGYVKTKGKAKAKEVKGAAGFAEVEDEHSKLISAILTGVNRALPFAKISSADVVLVLFSYGPPYR
jgi:ribosome biogenesis protein MAK21